MDKPLTLTSEKMITIGVVADTHIPDRVSDLHPMLISELRRRKVDYVFHCGDLSRRQVLEDLRAVAPVYAVRGNRDIFLRKELPISRTIIVNGVKIFLTHGHLTPRIYWSDKAANFLWGYRLTRYTKRLKKADPTARVYVFGHTHKTENTWVDEHLYFNPGGSSVGAPPDYCLSIGFIYVSPNGEIKTEITYLTGAVVKFKKWDIGEISPSGYR